MYSAYKGKNSFPKEKEILMINYLDKLDDDADGLSYKLGFCQVNKESILFVKNKLGELGIKTGKLSVELKPGRTKKIYSFGTSRKIS